MEEASHDPKWHVIQSGLSAQDGAKNFNIMEGDQFSSFRKPSTTDVSLLKSQNTIQKTIEVDSCRLDTIFSDLKRAHGFSRPFLKMDTQGYDLDVFLGSSGIHDQLLGIQSELSIRRLYESAPDIFESISVYRQHGFELSSLVPNNSGHFPLLLEIDGLLITDLNTMTTTR